MLQIAKWGLRLNYLFWGSILLCGILYFVMYNGFGNTFEYKCINTNTFIKKRKTNGNYKLDYSYKVNDKVYKNSEGFSKTHFNRLYTENEKIKVCYNNTFNQISFLEKRNLGIQRAKVQMLFSGVFLFIFVLIGLFANLEKWAKRYEKVLE